MSTIIETHGLTKRYRDKLAVNELDLEVEDGEIFGFLGPNGAGKTTTILMLLGLTEPTAGRATVCGFDPTRQPLEVKRRVGYLPENPGFYDDMSGWENLYYIAKLNRIPDPEARRRVKRLLEQVGLGEDGERPVREYSRGMKQRLGIAEVLVKEPRVLILDEPTLGIDPDGAVRILELINNLRQEHGLAILLSTHLLHQVQGMCSRIGIIVRGRLIAKGNLTELGSAITKDAGITLSLEVSGPADGLQRDLRALNGVIDAEPRGRGWFLRCSRDVRPELVSLITQKGLTLLQLKSEELTLEEIYLKYFREA
ncbi:MAG TPA: ABC transporter ATP-binding protein [Candidatus Acidoferrales bacterium]|nr:ABC transporter ATP-binding protein [Candidatus Acidoferrales bacterium]